MSSEEFVTESIGEFDVIDIDESETDGGIVFSVNSFGADFLVDGLISRLRSGDIYTPPFQRKFVWTLPQASRFFESILLGLPIPGIFLYREESRKLLIIDGLQRLTTIEAYASNLTAGGERSFPSGDEGSFRLKNLNSGFNNKKIADLEESDRRRFFDTTIHATIIQQVAPENDSSSAYYIFERLNTGGTPLQPQEIRSALYHGKFQTFILDLNRNELWRKVFGPEHKRSKDQELILRFFSFKYRQDLYRAPMKIFLNEFMNLNRNLDVVSSEEMSHAFLSPLEFIVNQVGEKPFRPVRTLNAAAFDAVMVTVSNHFDQIAANKNGFVENYNALMNDKDFLRLITRSTADDQSVKDRFRISCKYLLGAE